MLAYKIAIDSTILNCNKHALKTLGYAKKDELVGKPLLTSVYAPSSQEKARQLFLECEKAGRVRDEELQVITKQGKIIDVLLNADTIYDEKRRPLYSISTQLEIMERKMAEEPISRQTELLQRTFDGITDAVFILDAPSPPSAPKILECNEAASRVFCYEKAEMLGKSTDFLHVSNETLKEFQSQLYPAVAEGHLPFHLSEFRMRRKDGSEFPSEHVVTQLLNEKGDRTGWISIVRDITERKRAEQILRESEEKYRKLFEQAMDGIALADVDTGILLDCNQALAALVGRNRTELIGQHQAILHPPASDDRTFSPTFKLHATTHEGQVLETQVVTSTAEIREVEIKASLLYLQGRKILQGIFRDITERKRVEEALRRRAEELAALQATVLDITGHHNLPTLLQTIVERAARLLGAPAGGMYLCDPERQEARCVVSYNTPHDYSGTVLKYGEGAAGMVAQTGEPLIVDDYRSWQGRASVFDEKQPFGAVLTVPMIWQGRVTGVIHVLDDTASRRFTRADQEVLSLFANHAAIAVENTRLLEGEKLHAEELARYSTNLEQLVFERTGKLAESERRFRELSDLLPQIVFEIDESGNVQYMNHAGLAATGLREEELSRGLSAFHFLAPAEHDRATRGIQRVMTGEMIVEREFTVLRRDGTSFPGLVYTAPIMRGGKTVGVRGIAIDITQRKRVEEELRAARERLEYVISSNPAVIFTGKPHSDHTDFDNTYMSGSVTALLGYEPRDFIDDPEFWSKHVHPEDLPRVRAAVHRMFQDGHLGVDYRFIHKDERYRWVHEEVRLVRDSTGNPLEVIGYWTDVTEQKQMQEAFLRSQRLATIGEITAMVGHDLRNPLQSVVSTIYLAKKKLESSEVGPAVKSGLLDMLETIANESEYMNKIVSDLQDYSAPLRTELIQVDMQSLLKEILSKIRVPQNIKVSFVVCEQLPTLVIDPSMMKRAFTNLILNAIQAMPEGGELEIAISGTTQHLIVAFKDTGVGIPAENMSNLFTTFFTTKAKGQGLGLPVCKRLVEAHGGTMSVESQPGKGSTFTVKLPFKNE